MAGDTDSEISWRGRREVPHCPRVFIDTSLFHFGESVGRLFTIRGSSSALTIICSP